MENVQALSQLVANVGFPIFMTIYLMSFMNKQQSEMRNAIEELKNAIVILTERIGSNDN